MSLFILLLTKKEGRDEGNSVRGNLQCGRNKTLVGFVFPSGDFSTPLSGVENTNKI